MNIVTITALSGAVWQGWLCVVTEAVCSCLLLLSGASGASEESCATTCWPSFGSHHSAAICMVVYAEYLSHCKVLETPPSNLRAV